MPLIRLEKVSLAYGHRPLLDKVDLEIRANERVCLVGRNGEGKSSLMRVINGEATADDGKLWVRPGVRVAHLAQEVSADSTHTVFDVVAAGLPELGDLISRYHHVVSEMAHDHSDKKVEQLAKLQHELEAVDGWRLEQRIETILSRLQLDGDARMDSLSGGWRRRVMLAQALVTEPDVLLLDEPTNHLDIEAIMWLEEFMVEFGGALLFISHDRAFVRRLATRIIELDRGHLTSWPGNYDDYLRRKAEQLEVEAQQNALFDKRLSQEEAWIRQGIKARRTRNEGRVRALKAMREERRQRRERGGKAALRVEQGEQSGRIVFEAENASYAYDAKPVIKDFSIRIMRGDRIGIIGPNGAGKSTLIKLLLGDLVPDSGTVRQGTRLQVAYFDQTRAQLDPSVSVMDSVSEGSSSVTINGQSKHVAGYLRDFLFPPERLHSPVSTLSGGERNRLLLARLFAQPANLLVLDEPTNDLDVETLELLEELLIDYQGTLLLVSHDRAFLDNVVTATLVFEGEGKIGEYVGGYSDWEQYQQSRQRNNNENSGIKSQPVKTVEDRGVSKQEKKPAKRSYKEQRELETLPLTIEKLEGEQEQLQAAISDPEFYRGDSDSIAVTLSRLEDVNTELEQCYARWEQLES